MKAFTSVSEWLNTNPSTVEVSKVLATINRLALHQTREDLYKHECRLRKLNRSLILLTESKIKLPKELTDEVTNTKKLVAELKKQLPPKKIIRRKVAPEVIEEVKVEVKEETPAVTA